MAMQGVSDEQLIRWVAGGDVSYLGTLFERHHRSLYRYCLQLTHSSTMSEDLVQDVFLKLLRKACDFRGESSCRVWIFSIARNVTFDRMRRAQREAETEMVCADSDERLIDHRSAEQVVAARQNLRLVAQALAHMPATAREVIWLGRFVFDDYAELAQVLGCSPGAARVRMHRALQQLSSTFTRMNGVSLDVWNK